MISVLDSYLLKIVTQILNPLLQFMVAVAFLVFVWGVFIFIRDAGEPSGRDKGRKTILWGLVGLAIIFGAYGIVGLITNTIGVDTVQPLQTSPAPSSGGNTIGV